MTLSEILKRLECISEQVGKISILAGEPEWADDPAQPDEWIWFRDQASSIANGVAMIVDKIQNQLIIDAKRMGFIDDNVPVDISKPLVLPRIGMVELPCVYIEKVPEIGGICVIQSNNGWSKVAYFLGRQESVFHFADLDNTTFVLDEIEVRSVFSLIGIDDTPEECLVALN